MKRCVFLTAMLAVVVAVFFCGCDGGGGGGSSTTRSLSGEWTLTFDSGMVIQMKMVQESDGSVQGVGKDETGDAWSLSGSLKGDRLTAKMLPELDISALVDDDVIAGTYHKNTKSGSFTGARQ